MLETVVSADGTAVKATVPGYRVAGKTGTVRKATAGGYSENRHSAVFGGLAPASEPRLAVVVVIHEPSGDKYYAGDVAAPVFAEVTAAALRVLGVPPDKTPPASEEQRVIQAMRQP
jgi:cell division protein FtsI (penicillin-binding protein 3)